MLSQVTAERIDQLRALANQEIIGRETAWRRACRSSVLTATKRMAGGPDCRLANGFCVRRVILLTPDERFDIDRRNQPNFMTESADGASPVMGAPAGLHRDDTARALGQKSETLSRESALRNATPPSARAPCI